MIDYHYHAHLSRNGMRNHLTTNNSHLVGWFGNNGGHSNLIGHLILMTISVSLFFVEPHYYKDVFIFSIVQIICNYQISIILFGHLFLWTLPWKWEPRLLQGFKSTYIKQFLETYFTSCWRCARSDDMFKFAFKATIRMQTTTKLIWKLWDTEN